MKNQIKVVLAASLLVSNIAADTPPVGVARSGNIVAVATPAVPAAAVAKSVLATKEAIAAAAEKDHAVAIARGKTKEANQVVKSAQAAAAESLSVDELALRKAKEAEDQAHLAQTVVEDKNKAEAVAAQKTKEAANKAQAAAVAHVVVDPLEPSQPRGLWQYVKDEVLCVSGLASQDRKNRKMERQVDQKIKSRLSTNQPIRREDFTPEEWVIYTQLTLPKKIAYVQAALAEVQKGWSNAGATASRVTAQVIGISQTGDVAGAEQARKDLQLEIAKAAALATLFGNDGGILARAIISFTQDYQLNPEIRTEKETGTIKQQLAAEEKRYQEATQVSRAKARVVAEAANLGFLHAGEPHLSTVTSEFEAAKALEIQAKASKVQIEELHKALQTKEAAREVARSNAALYFKA